MSEPNIYPSREAIAVAFTERQRADFSPRQVADMIAEADAAYAAGDRAPHWPVLSLTEAGRREINDGPPAGASHDHGDGYRIYRAAGGYAATVRGHWI